MIHHAKFNVSSVRLVPGSLPNTKDVFSLHHVGIQ
jgi:hypothetical protein